MERRRERREEGEGAEQGVGQGRRGRGGGGGGRQGRFCLSLFGGFSAWTWRARAGRTGVYLPSASQSKVHTKWGGGGRGNKNQIKKKILSWKNKLFGDEAKISVTYRALF